MKVSVEFRTDMSRPETFRALRIVLEAVERLAHRMSDAELARVADFGAALNDAAEREKARRTTKAIECSAERQLGGEQATPASGSRRSSPAGVAAGI